MAQTFSNYINLGQNGSNLSLKKTMVASQQVHLHYHCKQQPLAKPYPATWNGTNKSKWEELMVERGFSPCLKNLDFPALFSIHCRSPEVLRL